jgi:S-adenosylmethionine-diacylgycerolhomoserine-N-methlytransferase
MTGPLEEHLREQRLAVARYYRFHARIYDLTRWSFLKGRETLMQQVAACVSPTCILEVGCGTGMNLLYLGQRFPLAQLWGIDLSAAMLSVTEKKLQSLLPRFTLVHAAYDRPLAPAPQFDLVVFSYVLSMFNPGWEEALDTAASDLISGGAIAVVDFHDSVSQLFKRWMGLHHVRLEGHLLPQLQARFISGDYSINPVFGGLWSYFLFLGQNP